MRDGLRRDTATAHSAGAAQSGSDQRGAPRFALLIRAAKLITPEGEFLCVVRDASETGVNVRVFHALPDCGAMMLEMQNGDQHELELIWQDSDRAGLKFLGPANIARIVESPSRFAKRPIRINLEVPAIVASGDERAAAHIHDISQQGAKITSDHRFSIDQRVRLSAQDLPEVNAKIRWRRDNAFGLVFEDTFQFGDLARIIAAMQSRKPA
ncbi:hypothetical protein GCM10009127_02690 [Alteraurantiacibacter aestuarii]|uniref:PilZ domain-containing protein n=1 Tax=Alteraurantiacibacter aestuarii TaxID=650004 RepID=A0A844ZNS4_9SPHN|nr:PilZ domain-containing protein [Alteraurantiacibacter aestuarii]MXO88477.1 PilZ domain-containing protein [Alteraurantiacibacter aestuarii]